MNIKEVRKYALRKKEILKKNNDDLDRINNIIAFLSDDMCFFKVDINLSIPILVYLGISEENVKDVYFQLISPVNYKGEYKVRKIIGK